MKEREPYPNPHENDQIRFETGEPGTKSVIHPPMREVFDRDQLNRMMQMRKELKNGKRKRF